MTTIDTKGPLTISSNTGFGQNANAVLSVGSSKGILECVLYKSGVEQASSRKNLQDYVAGESWMTFAIGGTEGDVASTSSLISWNGGSDENLYTLKITVSGRTDNFSLGKGASNSICFNANGSGHGEASELTYSGF